MMRPEFAGHIGYFTLRFSRADGEQHWNVVMRRQPVRLASDPAASLGVRRRDGRKEREIIGLRQAPTATGDSTERHRGRSCRHNIICLQTQVKPA